MKSERKEESKKMIELRECNLHHLKMKEAFEKKATEYLLKYIASEKEKTEMTLVVQRRQSLRRTRLKCFAKTLLVAVLLALMISFFYVLGFWGGADERYRNARRLFLD